MSFASEDKQVFAYEAEEGFRYLVQAVPDPQAFGGWALRTNPSVEDPYYKCYGPYKTFKPGNYVASFRLKIDE